MATVDGRLVQFQCKAFPIICYVCVLYKFTLEEKVLLNLGKLTIYNQALVKRTIYVGIFTDMSLFVGTHIYARCAL